MEIFLGIGNKIRNKVSESKAFQIFILGSFSFMAFYAFKLNICCEAFFAGNHDAAKAIIIAVKATRIKSVKTNFTGK
jgi:hypothetical protein